MTSQYRKAVFILAYTRKGKTIEYLLLKRKLHWKGWEFPKGKIEPKEKKIQTARRELREETGHKASVIKKWNYSGRYKYHKIFPDRPGMVGQTFSLYSSKVKKGKVSLDKKEHSDYIWVDYETAMKMLTWPNQKKSLKMVNKWLMKGK